MVKSKNKLKVEDNYMLLLNIFMIYYKKKNNIDKNIMTDETLINKITKEFYFYIDEYKNNENDNTELIELYDSIEIEQDNMYIFNDNYDIVYMLYINECLEKWSPTLITLLMYILDENIDYDKWNITIL